MQAVSRNLELVGGELVEGCRQYREIWNSMMVARLRVAGEHGGRMLGVEHGDSEHGDRMLGVDQGEQDSREEGPRG